MQQAAWTLLAATLALTWTPSRASDLCPDGMYLDQKSALCRLCTVCPVNTIVRVPCKPGSDTICGPFFEFTFFNNGEVGDNGGDDDQGATYPRQRGQDGPMTSSYQPDADIDKKVNDNSRDVIEKNSDRWRELCFGLIGALAAVSSLAVIYVIITHLRHRHGSCKNSSLDDCELPVVYYHTQLVAQTTPPDGNNSTAHVYTQLRQFPDSPLGTSAPDVGSERIGGKRAPPVFLLHPSPDREIRNWPLARVHDNYAKHTRPSGGVPAYGNPEHQRPAQVTEMLLSHHKCQHDAS